MLELAISCFVGGVLTGVLICSPWSRDDASYDAWLDGYNFANRTTSDSTPDTTGDPA